MSSSGHTYLKQLGDGYETDEVDPSDFDAVFRRYASYVSTIVYRLLGDRTGVEDIVQDVFIDAFNGIHTLENPDALKGWLATIAVRRVRKHIRRHRLKSFIGFGGPAEMPELVDEGASPEQSMLLRQVFEHLRKLATEDRLAWSLRHLEGMTVSEVARACQCSTSTVKRRIARAEERLEQRLKND